MVQRKTSRKKKNRSKSRSNKSFNHSLLKAFVGVACILILVVLAGIMARLLIAPKKLSPPPAAPERPAPATKIPVTKIPPFEIYPKKEIPPEKTPTIPPPEKKHLPQVVIIIDDLGYDKNIAEKLSGLNAKITFSILPHSPFQESIVQLARDRGLETMLHLPMEPNEYPNVDPGPGTLLTSMTPDQLIRQLEENLDALPDVKGVNNHMGSKMTTQSNQLYQIFSILKKRNLYFVDSRTSSDTLCKPSARLLQIPFAQRDVFLDHSQTARFIRKQIKELIRIAQRNGYAVGIGHPHPITYKILSEMLPELQKEVQLVPASALVHVLG